MARPYSLALLLLLACASPSRDDSVARSDAARDSVARARTDSVARARQDSVNRAQPGYIIDSILPIEEEVRRFKAAVGGEPVAALHDGAESMEALVARFSTAVSARDSTALRRLAVTPREFIDIIYPASPYTKPPYRQPPGLLWSQIQLPSASGYRRLLERLGGRPLRIVSHACPGNPEQQGRNRLWATCTVRFASGSAAARDGRLFGTIIERAGQFKFVSFANMY